MSPKVMSEQDMTPVQWHILALIMHSFKTSVCVYRRTSLKANVLNYSELQQSFLSRVIPLF